MGKSIALLTALFMAAVVLAGCADSSGGPDEVEVHDPDSFELEKGKGAIAGLLVDDRFRPIHLVEEAETELQSVGFILIQETGKFIRTTENGEFSLVDLDPGTYTLKVSAEGFEAAPKRVNVEEGIWNDAELLARRVAGQEDIIITQEHAAFASCFTNFVWLSATLDCTGDLSGDTDRAIWSPDLEEFNETLVYAVVEVLFENEAPIRTAYDAVTRQGGIGTDFSGFVLTDSDGRYGKMHLPIDKHSPDPWISGSGCDDSEQGPDGWCKYNTTKNLDVIIFGRGFFYQEIKDAYAPVNGVIVDNVGCTVGPVTVPSCLHEATMRRGAGGALATQATYMLSLFLYDPEADGEMLHESDYCVLCNPDG